MKIKTMCLTLLAATLILFTGTFLTLNVFAETDDTEISTETEEMEENGADEESGGMNIEELAGKFDEYLKTKYGEDYEYYYNSITESWGSVEGYLLAFGEKLPEKNKSGWDNFVGWLDTYKVIWVPLLSCIALILIYVFGKRQFNKIINNIVNRKLAPIIKELNLQDGASLATVRALKALMGTNDKFADNVKELGEAEKELGNG